MICKKFQFFQFSDFSGIRSDTQFYNSGLYRPFFHFHLPNRIRKKIRLKCDQIGPNIFDELSKRSLLPPFDARSVRELPHLVTHFVVDKRRYSYLFALYLPKKANDVKFKPLTLGVKIRRNLNFFFG